MYLRPYQVEAVNIILNDFKVCNRVMLQMPTGTGKTEVFAEVINKFISEIAPHQKVLVLVHTRELVGQIHKRLFLRCRIRSGLILSGSERSPNLQVQIASIQTLIRRDNWPQNISLIVIDEAHHTTAESYRNILKHYFQFKVKLLGVTATPQRLDGTGFKDLFDRLITTQSIKSFISERWLSDVKHLAVSNLNLGDIPVQNGDYAIGKLAEYMSQNKRLAEVTESYMRYGQGKKAIIFTVNQLHNQLVCARFKQLGITSDYIDSKTPKEERTAIIGRFERGDIKILCNVQIFTEGFDCPDVELCILARPTKSLTLYLQMIGRVMRPSPDKHHAIVLDNSMLWKEHKLVTTERKWTLEGCKTTNRIDVAVDESTGEAKEVPRELYGKDFYEITDDQIEIISRKTTFPYIRKGDAVRISIKQDRQGISSSIMEFRRISEGKFRVNEFAGKLTQALCSEINLHLRNNSSLFHRNKRLQFEVWFNGRNVTVHLSEWNGIVPNKKIGGEIQRKVGQLIYDSIRLIQLPIE